MKRKILLILLFITLIGAYFRISNLSPFTFYPDSYQSLIGALNILNYHSVVGYLGPQGMLYPDFFMWTHPGYPLLIIAFSFITHDLMTAARMISLLAGVIAIPLAFLYLKSVFKHPSYGLAGALLLATSYQHTIWSGFVMTETLGVLLTLLLLWSFFTSLRQKAALANPYDLLTGGILAFAILSRYEYAIITAPLVLYLLFTSQGRFIRLVNIFSALALVLALTVSRLFPIRASLSAITHQLPDLLDRGWKVLLPLTVIVIGVMLLPQRFRQRILVLGNKTIQLLLISGIVVLGAQLIFGSAFPLFYDLTLIRNFFLRDYLIMLFAVLGLMTFMRDPKLRRYAYFVLLSCILLVPLYHRVNPTMDRYMTHLIPYLLLPANYAFVKITDYGWKNNIKFQKVGIMSILIATVLTQSFISFRGLRYGDDPSWMKPAYQDKAAEILTTKITRKPDILIASLPEPYYYITGISTQSIADRPPFIFLDSSFDDKRALVIVDMGMRDVFPNFTKVLLSSLKDRPNSTFWVQERYHYSIRSEQEKYPVIMLEMTVKELKETIRTATSLQK